LAANSIETGAHSGMPAAVSEAAADVHADAALSQRPARAQALAARSQAVAALTGSTPFVHDVAAFCQASAAAAQSGLRSYLLAARSHETASMAPELSSELLVVVVVAPEEGTSPWFAAEGVPSKASAAARSIAGALLPASGRAVRTSTHLI
jgi:hypothetical protein